MSAQLESTHVPAFMLALGAPSVPRRTTTQRENVEREIHLDLLARDFTRWLPEFADKVAAAGARKLRKGHSS